MSGGGSSGGGNTTTVQKADPWVGQQGYLSNIFAEGQKLYNNNPTPQYYPGQTFADMSPETQMSLDMQTNRALAGSPLNNAAQQNLTDTLNGKYLDPNTNPYLQAGSDQILAKVLPQVNSQFARAGAGNSSMAARAAAEGATGAMGQLAMENYNNERTNQARAALMAPQLAQQDYADAARLGEVGSVKEDLAQQQINEAMQRYQYEQQSPWNALAQYNAMIQGNYGSTTTQAAPQQRRSIGAGMLGGGMAGYDLGNALNSSLGLTNGGLYGAGAGSLLGLL